MKRELRLQNASRNEKWAFLFVYICDLRARPRQNQNTNTVPHVRETVDRRRRISESFVPLKISGN